MTITLNDPPIQQFTPKLGLQLPVAGNPLGYDLGSLRAALSALDAAVDARATPADVTAAIALLVNSAPTTLDTLKELALAINNDPDFATHVATQLSTLAGQISALSTRAATASQLGLIKVGAGLIVDPDGMLSAVGGSGGSGLPVFDELEIVPTSDGQTTFPVSGGYNPGQVKLTMNGVELFGNGDDFTATNGTSFTLTDGSKVTTTGTKFKLTRWIYLPSSMALNKAGDTMTGALNWGTTVSLASAGTVSIGSAASNTITVTGTTTITSFDVINAGAVRKVTFAGALTLTHNATSLILPGGANITTVAGDVAEFESLGSGNWRCAWYSRADGKPVIRPTTVGGYGITDAVTTSGDQTIAGNKSFTGNVLLTGSGSLGYGAGAGGTVTQATSKSTTVTLNKQSGQITLNGSSMPAGVIEIFQFNNSNIVAPCVLALTLVAGSGTLQSYHIWASVGAGYAIIYCKNISAGTLAEAVQIDFAVIKGATS